MKVTSAPLTLRSCSPSAPVGTRYASNAAPASATASGRSNLTPAPPLVLVGEEDGGDDRATVLDRCAPGAAWPLRGDGRVDGRQGAWKGGGAGIGRAEMCAVTSRPNCEACYGCSSGIIPHSLRLQVCTCMPVPVSTRTILSRRRRWPDTGRATHPVLMQRGDVARQVAASHLHTYHCVEVSSCSTRGNPATHLAKLWGRAGFGTAPPAGPPCARAHLGTCTSGWSSRWRRARRRRACTSCRLRICTFEALAGAPWQRGQSGDLPPPQYVGGVTTKERGACRPFPQHRVWASTH